MAASGRGHRQANNSDPCLDKGEHVATVPAVGVALARGDDHRPQPAFSALAALIRITDVSMFVMVNSPLASAASRRSRTPGTSVVVTHNAVSAPA